MTTYKELAERLEETMHDDAGFHLAVDEAIEILRSLDAQKPIGYWGGAFSIEGGADLYEVEQVSAFGRVYKNLPLYAAPVAAQPPSQPVDPVHVINTAIDVMMRRDATIAGVLFDFMGWLTTRKERLCLSSADDASPAVTAITEFAKMRNLSLDNAMVTDWQSGAAQASKPLSDAEMPLTGGGNVYMSQFDFNVLQRRGRVTATLYNEPVGNAITEVRLIAHGIKERG